MIRSKLLIVIFCILLVILSACENIKGVKIIPKTEGELTALVKWDGVKFTVTNEDQFDWGYTMFGLNMAPTNRQPYLYLIDNLEKGKTKTIPGNDFFRGTDGRKLKVKEFELLTFTICEGTISSKRFWRGVVYEGK